MCNTCFNLDFHKPKKDQCEVCTDLKNLPPQQKKKWEEKYETYQKKKKTWHVKSRQMKRCQLKKTKQV